jgi:hypothetical protein
VFKRNYATALYTSATAHTFDPSAAIFDFVLATGTSNASITTIIQINGVSNANVALTQSDGSAISAFPAVISDPLGIASIRADGDVGNFTITWSASINGYVYAFATDFELDCSIETANLWPSASTGRCVPCTEIPQSQIDAMDRQTRLEFGEVCVQEFVVPEGLRWVLMIVSFVVMAGIIGFMVPMFIYRDHPVIRASSVVFTTLTLMGCLMAIITVPLLFPTGSALTRGICVARPWLGNLGFCLVFSTLFAKTYRLSRVFNNPTLKQVIITNRSLFKFVGVICGVVVVYLIVWSAVDTPHPQEVVAGSFSFMACRTNLGTMILMLMFTHFHVPPFSKQPGWRHAIKNFRFSLIFCFLSFFV